MPLQEELPFHVWKPIDLPDKRDLDYASPVTVQLDNLAAAWLQERVRLEEKSPDGLRDFVTRLVRRWSIETGIIERLYDLDEGLTETLVELGFRSDLLGRSESGPAADVLEMLNDHAAGAEMIRDVVAQGRPLTKGFVKELHSLLTRTQTYTEGRTENGQRVEIEMAHGEFKRLPNNPTRPDGAVHEYAPPIQVESEMDQLLEGLEILRDQSAAIQGAWLHHRFTQIHPFQDGNGRVGRALTNMVFIRAGLFPLVITRQDRSRYINALEAADEGDLCPLVDLFAEIEAGTIIKALSIAQDEQAGLALSTVESVLGRMVTKFGAQVRDREQVLRGVNDLAVELRDQGKATSEKAAQGIATQLAQTGVRLKVFAETGGPDLGTDHYWRFQVTNIAQDLGYWVNFREAQYWFRVALEGLPIRFQYVVSLHHVGHELSGVMQASAFAEFGVPRPAHASPEPSDEARFERNWRNCTPRVFSWTWTSTAEAEAARFKTWIDESMAVGLRYWMDLV